MHTGDCYTGNWERGVPHGQGKIAFPSGTVREGRFENGEIRQGKETISNEHFYEGEFEHSKRSGKGTCRWKDSAVYTGDWKDNMRHGKGVMTLRSGEVYDGLWVQDEPKDLEQGRPFI
jgi:hypothetical protein